MLSAARLALMCVALSVGVGAQMAPADPDLFRVTLLGTGNPRPSLERFGPSTLVEAGARRYVFDAGRGSSIRLFQLGSGPLLAGIDGVFLTHLHSDHVVGLPDLWLTPWIFGRARPLAVYGPPGTVAMVANLERAFAFDITMRRDLDERFPAQGIAAAATDVQPGLAMEQDGVRIKAFPVDHGPVTPSYGYRIDYRGRSIAISGDTKMVDAMVEHARGVDVLIHEVISPEVERRRARVVDPKAIERIIERHTTPEQAGRLFAQIKPRLAVYTHIVPSPATAEDLVGPTRTAYDGPLEVGRDLMRVTIGERILVETVDPPPDR
jgi:ribonuclease Z